MLDNLNLDIIFVENSIEECWNQWKEAFLSIMDKCIPKVNLPDRRNLPWLTKEVVNQIKKQNYYYRKSKKMEDWKTLNDTKVYVTVLYLC